MTRNARTYDHFCTLARALERVGERWTLLIVRDLLHGPRRFTDLIALLGGITPATLSQRLRQLTDAGLVSVEREPGRREVWYELTPAGYELAPVVDELARWGLRYARRAPMPGEPTHPEHLLTALRLVLEHAKPQPRPVCWHFHFVDDGVYTLRFDGEHWELARDADDATPDVVVTATTGTWARYLLAPPDQRNAARGDLDIEGTRREQQRFDRLLANFPDGA